MRRGRFPGATAFVMRATLAMNGAGGAIVNPVPRALNGAFVRSDD